MYIRDTYRRENNTHGVSGCVFSFDSREIRYRRFYPQFLRVRAIIEVVIENGFLSVCRQSCGANGIFSRRLDFSAFNSLPRTKLNSYHIKVSDLIVREQVSSSIVLRSATLNRREMPSSQA